jgi:RNA polymerase sigma-70 factor (family 1)
MQSYKALSDIELATMLKEGDHVAYTEIFSRYNKLLYSHAYNKLRESEEAKDIVHEIFYSLWAHREKSVPSSNLIGYLFTAVRYKIADFLSKKNVQTKYIASFQDFIDQNPEFTDDLVRERELRDIINEEIAALPPRMQQVFRLSRYEQLTYKEIAAKLEISEETVKDQVKKALRILRTRLGLIGFLLFYLHNL